MATRTEGDRATTAEGIVSLRSTASVDETLARIAAVLDEKQLTTFAIIDHSGEAEKAGLQMPNTKLIIFGNPAGGTPAMVASPLTAIDLPLKLLVWDDDGSTRVSYNTPDFLARRHQLAPTTAAPLAAIERIAEQVVTN
jgi:uncharacterized protein (DUF302 family)